MGERVLFAVEAEQPGYVDDAIVHLPPLGLPRHLLQQLIKQSAGAAQPARQQIDPGAAPQILAGHHATKRTERAQHRLVAGC